MTQVFRAAFAACGLACAAFAGAATFTFTTGAPNGLMAMASRPGSSAIEIEAADDFIVATQTTLTGASFTGLIPAGASLATISAVDVEIYRVFPQDSDTVRAIQVPQRANSPSDVAFTTRDGSNSTFTASTISPNFTAANSVLNGIHPIPTQTTGGEGAVTGDETSIAVTFTTPIVLPPGHYFFVPQVLLTSGNFFWLSGQRPTVPPFLTDLQAWIRDANLSPDWLRVGTDIVGGAGGTQPTFNGSFTVTGTALASLTVTGVPVSVREGTAFSGAVANFTDTDAAQNASNFTATIAWGDGTSSAGTITGSAGTFAVTGSHTYADEGAFTVQVTVDDAANTLTGSGSSTATVEESDVLTGTGLAITAHQGSPFSGPVATFSDAFTVNTAADFTATIAWGDGVITAGTVSGTAGGYTVSGSHTYAAAGTFPVSVTLTDDAPGTATATVLGSAAVSAPLGVSGIPTLSSPGLALLALSLALSGLFWTLRRH